MADRLNPDEGLNLTESIASVDGRFRLTMQEDGNLVLYSQWDNRPLWASGTSGQMATYAIMQGDGNLVIFGPNGPLWATGTSNHPGSYLILQNDGNLVIYQPHPIWHTQTSQPQPWPR